MSGKRSLLIRNFDLDDKNERFLLIFHQNTINNNFYSSKEEFLNTNSLDKYSIFGYIDDSFKTTDNSYEFILEYPETSQYARWRQTLNPLEANLTDDVGYKKIKITWDVDDRIPFVGLHISERQQNCYLDGTNTKNYLDNHLFYYAIGLNSEWSNSNKLPGYIYNDDLGQIHEAFLWLKITNNDILKKIPLFKTCELCNISQKLQIILVFITIFIIK